MKVKELRELLDAVPDAHDVTVVVCRGDESRVLKPIDFTRVTQVYDADTSEVVDGVFLLITSWR